MRNFLIAALVLAVASYAGCRIVRALASDETKIRWLIEDAEEGFNETSARRTVGVLSKDWGDEAYPLLDRDTLRAILFRFYFLERDPKTKAFLLAVEVPRDSISVELDPGDEDSARAECTARFTRLRDGERKPAWEIHILGDLRRGEDGWRFVRTRHETLAGAVFWR